MYNLRAITLIVGLLTLQGCAAVALTAGSMAAGQGVNHTLSGITYKTFAASIEDMRAATFKTLDRLDMDVTDQIKTKSGWEIKALAYNRTIEIELEALTRRATRMRVVANKGEIFFKDAATATEIIIQTAETLQMDLQASLQPVEWEASAPPAAAPAESAGLPRRY